jgi:hypothetical protein
MAKPFLRHHNNCPRCPVIGAEDIPDEEYYELLSLRFSIRIAHELSSKHNLTRVDPADLAQWRFEHARILESHVDHIPRDSGHGIMVTLPVGCGMPLIDGNHRAACALREERPFSRPYSMKRRRLSCCAGAWARPLCQPLSEADARLETASR